VLRGVQVDRMVGTATLRASPGGRRRSLAEGELTLHRGAELSTGSAGGLGLLLPDGRSLRFDAATRLRIEDTRRLVLLAGAVYVDSGPAPETGGGLEIVTAAGSAREFGTQFEARLLADVLHLRVREGRVLAGAGEATWLADAGEELWLGGGRLVERRRIAGHAPAWDWVQALAPAPYARDMTVAELLDWVSRETGRHVEFARPELGRRVAEIRLHGSPRRFTPMEAMAVMLATTDLGYTVAGEREILIHARH
jgi:ferric-dicitrate binding protein FerR (iron transport regulator)